MEKNLYSLFELLDKDDIEKTLGSINKYGSTNKKIYDISEFDPKEHRSAHYAEISLDGKTLGYIVDVGELSGTEPDDGSLQNSANILEFICGNNLKLKKLNEELKRSSDLKSSFLANMSHEIRTPMNAVIGLAEMALREDLSPTVEGYVRQIESSGQLLLTIINDVLDFAKIEAGKLDIIYSEYNVMQMISDVGNAVMPRIGNKDIELIMDVNPRIPKMLVGDCVRIKQVLINLATNAVKFTDSGTVTIWIDFIKKSDFEITLLASVEDTGIGIKEEDMGRLFDSFTQLESRKDRTVEGTGLGLAISKNLVTLMNGNMLVESKYGVGSKFAFQVPQRIAQSSPSIELHTEKPIKVGIVGGNEYVKDALRHDLNRLMAAFYDFKMTDEMDYDFIFLDKESLSEDMKKLALANPQTTFAVITGYCDSLDSDIPNVIYVRRPMCVNKVSAILNHEDPNIVNYVPTGNYINFCAPDAKVLLVDDNEINLTVVEGLLEPLQMQIDTATRGKQALQMMKEKKYDMIFMDHMMPEMDGVEVTHIIRRDYPEYNMVPIIALTANAVEESKSMFLMEGMNDFISKPVEPRLLIACIKRWLPKELQKHIAPAEYEKKKDEQEDKELPVIEGLNTAEAVRLLGSVRLFWKILENYYRDIDKRSKIIRGYYEEKNWDLYTIEVHSLKSTSGQVGAMKLADLAEALERAGKDNDIEKIINGTEDMLKVYESYKSYLAPYFNKTQNQENTGASPLLEGRMRDEYLGRLREAAERLDFDTIEQAIAEMDTYSYSEDDKKKYEALKDAFDNVDFDALNKLLQGWV